MADRVPGMSLNVGALWVRTADRDRVVALIRQYWTERGAQPITTDPLQVEPLSVDKTGQLAFAVAPPATSAGTIGAVEAGAGDPVWVAVYDSQRYTADSELAAHLQKPLGTVKAWVRRGMASLRGCVEARIGTS